MALTNNLSSTGKDILRKRFFGKFNTLIYAQGINGQFQKQPSDIKTLNLGHLSFKDELFNHAQKTGGGWKDYVILAHDPSVLYVFIPQFVQTRDISVIVDTSIFGLVDLQDTIEDEYDSDPFLVGMNGNLVVQKDPNSLLPSFEVSGFVYQNGVQVIAGDSKPTRSSAGNQLMSFQYYQDQGQYQFDFLYGKDPSKGDGLGGLSPIIFNQQLLVSPGEPPEGGIINTGYHTLSKQSKTIGKHILAYRSDHQESSVFDDSAFIFFVKDEVDPGLKFNAIRNWLGRLDFDNAVGLDGSDSLLLYEKPKRLLIKNGIKKNLFCKTGYCIR